MSWTTSTRRARLPTNWAKTQRRILERDGHRCYLCAAHATEVDHVRNGDDHSDANLAAICEPDHRRKSSAEGGRAARPRTKRPSESHPGLR